MRPDHSGEVGEEGEQREVQIREVRSEGPRVQLNSTFTVPPLVVKFSVASAPQRTYCEGMTNRKHISTYFSKLLSLSRDIRPPPPLPNSPLASPACSGQRRHMFFFANQSTAEGGSLTVAVVVSDRSVWWSSYFPQSRFKTKTMLGGCHLKFRLSCK